MNPTGHHDLSSLLSHLTSILDSQNLLHHPSSPSAATATCNDQHAEEPRILPPSIPPLPSSLTILPSSPSSSPLEDLSALLQTHVLPYLTRSSLSSRYYGFVIGGATPAALLADTLVSVYDQNVMVHLPEESVTTVLEKAALDLTAQLFRLSPEEWRGATFTTGATGSNVLGLAMGREWVVGRALRLAGEGGEEQVSTTVADVGLVGACVLAKVKGIKILSSMPHSSVGKSAAVVGIGRTNVVDVGGGDEVGVGVDVARFKRVADDLLADGWLCVLVLSAGEVNTGRFATDGLATMTQLRDFCDRRGIWIHVDAAFGLFGRVLVSPSGIPIEGYERVVRGTEGLELADSITGDAHKLLNVPYDCGLFFTRHKSLSEQVFSNGNAAYLKSTPSENEGPQIHSPLNIGIENSRRFRALPVWATLMTYGREGYVDMLRRQIGLARKLVEWMWDFEGLQVLPKSDGEEREAVLQQTFMIVLFRAADDKINENLVKTINATGRMYVGGTRWDGAPAARIAISNWQVDVERDFAVVREVLTGIVRQE